MNKRSSQPTSNYDRDILALAWRKEMSMLCRINRAILELVQGDITEQDTDAIVNAANERLRLGGGVAGAIRKKGDPAIQAECTDKAPIGVGQAVITTGGNLKARYVIHAVGPRMGEGEEDAKLAKATWNALKVADENNLHSVALPAISTGIFGYPMDRCAQIMIKSAIEYLSGATALERVVLCLYDEDSYDAFAFALEPKCGNDGNDRPSAEQGMKRKVRIYGTDA